MTGMVRLLPRLSPAAGRTLSAATLALLTGLAGPAPAQTQAQTVAACDDALVPQPPGCARANADAVVVLPLGQNVEVAVDTGGADFADTGFAISIDGQAVAGAAAPPVPERAADIALAAAGVDLRFDGDRKSVV